MNRKKKVADEKKERTFREKRKEGEQSKIQRKMKEPRACTHLCTQIKTPCKSMSYRVFFICQHNAQKQTILELRQLLHECDRLGDVLCSTSGTRSQPGSVSIALLARCPFVDVPGAPLLVFLAWPLLEGLSSLFFLDPFWQLR